MRASFYLSYTVLKGNLCIFKNKGLRVLPCWTLYQTLDLEKFALAYWSSKRVIDLALQGGCSERDKLDCCWSTKLTIPSISDTRPLVYHSNHQALFAERLSRMGLLATAGTCFMEYSLSSWLVPLFFAGLTSLLNTQTTEHQTCVAIGHIYALPYMQCSLAKVDSITAWQVDNTMAMLKTYSWWLRPYTHARTHTHV